MLRKALSLIAIASAAVTGTVSADYTTGPDEYIWRGEYENALEAVSEDPIADIAAYLTMAGDVCGASEILDSGDDPLRKGILAFKSGDFTTALHCTDGVMANPFLEGYRLAVRAASFHEKGLNENATAEIEAFFELTEKDAAAVGHPALYRIANLYIGAAVAIKDGKEPVCDSFKYTHLLSRESILMVARWYLEDGPVERSKIWFIKGMAIERDTSGTELFAELTEGFHRGRVFDLFSKDELLSTADKALRIGSDETVRILIGEIADRFPGIHEIKYLKGRLLSRSGKSRKALGFFESIFKSGAPVSLKKEALLRAASLKYRLKLMGDASDKYRLFGMYYPDDPRSDGALDRAARIEVSRKNWPKALKLWKEMRSRGVGTHIEKQAVLSEAVLRYSLGKKEHAYRILEDLLPMAGGKLEAAVLYWLQRTSPSEEKAAFWNERLMRSYPLSFYAMESGCKKGNHTLLDNLSKYSGTGLESMEHQERSFYDSLESGPAAGDPVYSHPAYTAYTYFLEKGLLEEAEDCGRELVNLSGCNRELLSIICRKAREKGMVDFVLSLTDKCVSGGGSENFPLILKYPVAYSSIVSEQVKIWDIPASLVLSVMREESRFDRHAVSRAGARGLMQIMPSTGIWVAGKIGEEDMMESDLFSPRFNIQAGIWYLRYLLDRFEGSTVNALAAYNAGAARVKRWRKAFKQPGDPMIALELIGVKETREYVKKVLDSIVIYHLIYGSGTVDET